MGRGGGGKSKGAGAKGYTKYLKRKAKTKSNRSQKIAGKLRPSKNKQRVAGKISNVNRHMTSKAPAHYRSKQTIRRLKMYKSKVILDAKGRVLGGELLNQRASQEVARVQPDRRWFGNTRVVGQKELEEFREEMGKELNNPYSVIIKQAKLPMALLNNTQKTTRMHLLETESFGDTYGPKCKRKRPKLQVSSLDSMTKRIKRQTDDYEETGSSKDSRRLDKQDEFGDLMSEPIMMKGQSNRIRGELFKVIDSCDVLIQVLDARDPLGTRALKVEKYLKNKARHKHLILLLNKVDLVPTWVTKRWIKHLSAQYPTVAFHASITNSFGKGELINLLRQFSKLHPERQHISVGFFGYPNVGKSSIINTLKKKKVCVVAPIPGQTKVWQYVTLFSNIYLVDCPGVVYPEGNTDTDAVLKGVVRMERIEQPEQYIAAILERVKPEYITKTYKVESWKDDLDFLTQYANKCGKLLKGGEPDINNISRMILHDWERGKLPWFICPPFEDDLEKKAAEEAETASTAKEKKEFKEHVDMDFEPVEIRKRTPGKENDASQQSSSSTEQGHSQPEEAAAAAPAAGTEDPPTPAESSSSSAPTKVGEVT